MYLIVYTGKNAKALQGDNSAEIPNTYKIQPFRTSLIIATNVPNGAWVGGQRSEVRGQRSEVRGQRSEVRILNPKSQGFGCNSVTRCQVSGVRKAKKAEY
jgi:hypothetical protein